MINILKHPETGEVVCADRIEDYPEHEFIKEDRLPEDGEVWDNGWVKIEGLEEEVTQKEWNRLPKSVRSYIFHSEARIYQLEQRVAAIDKILGKRNDKLSK